MGKQENAFLEGGEGDRWHLRNIEKLRPLKSLPILNAIKLLPAPKKVIEFGCGGGVNIGAIQDVCQCEAEGVDPSDAAINHARSVYPNVKFTKGTALYRYLMTEYDLVIYGFCLYLCDRTSLSRVVSIGDIALRDGGHLIIHDFDPEFPHKVHYHHLDGLFSYKMNYAGLWLANPAYTLAFKNAFSDGTAVWVLRKDIDEGWPLGEV